MNKSQQTLAGVLALIAVLIVISLIILPLLNVRRGGHRQHDDRFNLRGIYQGMMGYAGENSDRYPAYQSGRDSVQGFTPYLRGSFPLIDQTSEQFKEATDSNISAAMWLLVREDHLPVKIFINPLSHDRTDEVIDNAGDKVTITDIFDFKSPENFSYSFMNIYHEDLKAQWSHSMSPTRVIASNDNNAFSHHLNTTTPTNYNRPKNNKSMLSQDNSQMHINILFGDGHAELVKHPIQAFRKSDNIYTWWDAEGDKNDKQSIATIIQNHREIITSNRSNVNIKKANINKDVFLIPVEALVQIKE